MKIGTEDYVANSGQVYKCPILVTLPYSPEVVFNIVEYSGAVLKLGALVHEMKSLSVRGSTVAGICKDQK